MVGREGEEARVFKRSGHFFRVAAFHRGLHQIPVAAVMLEKKDPRAIGHDPAPFIDSSGVGDARHTLHARTRDRVHDEKEQPGTKNNRAGKKSEIDPPRRALGHLPFSVKLGSPLRREFRIEAHAHFEGIFRTPWRNICRLRNGVPRTVDGMDRREETVTLAGNGFDKVRILRVILNGRTELLQGGVQAAVKINVRTFGPK